MWCCADWWNTQWLESWFQHSYQSNLPHSSQHLSPSVSTTHVEDFVQKIHQGHVTYAIACGTNMAATFQAFHAEYYLWHSDWLKLLGWLAARNSLLYTKQLPWAARFKDKASCPELILSVCNFNMSHASYIFHRKMLSCLKQSQHTPWVGLG